MREMGSASVDPVADLAVREIYERARLDPSRAVGAVRLAVELFGERCICLAPPRELPGPSALVWGGPEPVIHVRRGLNPRQLNQAVAHELGEWQLHVWGYHGPEAEELAGRIGAALCVPREAFHVAHRAIGNHVGELSRAFTVSESLMSLRLGECLGYPTALITPRRIRTRGEAWDWPTTSAGWRELAVRPGAAGLTRERIGDAWRRFVLRAPESLRSPTK
jgi:hypothetical protein